MKAHSHTWKGGFVPDWLAPAPPEPPEQVGRLRCCSWCGSMHPEDLAAALRAGATLHFADWKYGWPHKSYVEQVPNPFAGMPEVRTTGGGWDAPDEDPGKVWKQLANGRWQWHETPKPADATTRGKFYTEHLQDAGPADAETIQQAMKVRFTFDEVGKVTWGPYEAR